MPLVKRQIVPVRLALRPSSWGAAGEVTFQGDYDLTAVTNVTLCGALRQLASLVVAAQGMSRGLERELVNITTRAAALTSRLASLEHALHTHNPRTVPVPEGDLRSFSERAHHYHHTAASDTHLFTLASRPEEVLALYHHASLTPLHIMREIDQLRDDGVRSSRYFVCEPVLGDSLKKEKLRKLNLDIETRRPASFVALREWCSDDETLTEVSLAPVSPSVPASVCPPQQEPAQHKLPSPEQRVLALSLKYPPQLVPIDVSGTGFKRLEKFRQSLVHFEYYKGKRRRKRVKRRNTIADTRDARIVLAGCEPSTSSGRGRSSPRSGSPSSREGVSFTDRSFDTTETLETTSNTTKTSSDRENHLHALGLEVNIPVPPRHVHTVSRRMAKEKNTFRENELINEHKAGSSVTERTQVNGSQQASGPHHNHVYEKVKNSKRDTSADKHYPQKSHLPISSHSAAMNVAVKLREGTRDDGTHSSSGNWSASSSTRTSVEFDQQRPAASPTSSLEQDSILSESLQIRSSSPSSNQRTNSRTTDDFPSTSSHASDGTLTPTQDIQDIPFLDDDTSSAYSCDTEGYYTSFHIDSGLRSVSYEGNTLACENEYELFGKGSTGTTNSSASLGTVVMRNPEKKTPPKPPQRVSSLERKRENRESIITVIHVNGSTSSREDVAGDVTDRACSQDGDSRSSRDGDSGRETSSSPTEPTSPRQPSLPSPELEFTESDLEAERQEILRVKTTINSSRIPSMCVITPPQSDDESVRSGSVPLSRENSGSQIDSQGQQTPPQGILGSLASQGQTHGVTAKLLSFQSSGAKSGSARSGGAISSGKAVVDASINEKKDPVLKGTVLPHGYTPTLTVIPRGKDGDINAHLKGIMHTAAVASPARPDPDQPVLIRPSLVKQAEREKRLSQESDEKQHAELQKQVSKEHQKITSEKSRSQSSELVSYKELPPPTATGAHPFSAVPTNVKQSVVITPTNSLERRKTNLTKSGARVTLNSDGKVVYSSDSLPRRKGHSSFEPGPYIKQVGNSSLPQSAGGTSNAHTLTASHLKSSVSTAPSSIQHQPLPASTTSNNNTVPVTQSHPMAQRPQQPLPPSASYMMPTSLLPTPSQSKQTSDATSQSTQHVSSLQPVASSLQPVMSSLQPAASSLQPITSSLQPITSSLQPAASSLQPAASSLQPAASSLQPVASSLQPVASSVQPVTSVLQPVSSSLQSVSSTVHHQSTATQSSLVGSSHCLQAIPSQYTTTLPSHTHVAPVSQPHPTSSSSQSYSEMSSQPQSAAPSQLPPTSLSQPLPVLPPQSMLTHSSQLFQASQLLSSITPQPILPPSTQPVTHPSTKTQTSHPKQDSHPTLQKTAGVPQPVNVTQAPSSVPTSSSQLARPPQPLPQQRLQQSTQPPLSPGSQKQVAFVTKSDADQSLGEKRHTSVAGSSNGIYGTTQQQQQLKQQQQQIYQARQEAQRQLLQQQQLQIYQTRQEAQRAIQQQQQMQQQLIYQTREEAQRQLQQQQQLMQQQALYQTRQEVHQAQQQQLQQQQLQATTTSASVIMASQGAPMSPRSQRAGAYVHVQGQVTQGTATQQVATVQPVQSNQSSTKIPQRPQSAHGYPPGGTTSRAPTPVQGPITSSPRRGAQASTEAFTHPHLRTDPGLLYGSQRSLQSVGLVAEGRGTSQQPQPPRPMSTSPPPYSEQHSIIDSDIYGRIGMTRHVQVGGTLPAGFGRYQRGYSSLPPSRRQSFVPQTQQQQQHLQQLTQQQQQQLSRRSSVASYTTGMDSRGVRRSAASNPSTPEKVLDKKEKSSKKEKDKDKKKKEGKSEKPTKKKWFWTLPLRRKKKNKDESTEDDDGGFKAASEKGARKPVPPDDSSFIRYPSPDTASSDMNSSYSSEISGEQSYRSSPSAEVYYYSRRAQHQAMQLQQQQQQQQGAGGIGPRSLPTTPVSPPDSNQSSFVSVNPSPQSVMSDVTDLTVTDLTRGRRYMSREELYSAMRHPQYYNSNRGTVTGPTGDFANQKTTPTSSRSTSPAVFGVNPLPPYTIRPQVQNVYGSWPPDQQINQQETGVPPRDPSMPQHSLPDSQSEDISPTADVDPPEGYQDLSCESLGRYESQSKQSPSKLVSGQDSQQSQLSQQNLQSLSFQQTQSGYQSQPSQSTPKQTTLGDFKKMILNKSMSSAGSNQRISAVEMLKASRPGIYGYSPPPAPVVKPPQPSPSQIRGEGVIIPPSSRNTARALLFQSRFGSGRRFRTPKTEIISTTILEDHGGEVWEEEEEEEEEEDDSSAGSPERQCISNLRGPLERAYSEPCSSNRTTSSPPPSPVDHSEEILHSTPNTTLDQPPQPPDLSIITADAQQDIDSPSAMKDNEADEKESMETAL
ncbi:actin remodeling regulator NHS isoform X1 [Procambarus clarkii]|uniref:actin remodeling regulator NHS isoform X1 n=2 Tax=Procambarus clarkii TaxID=6728 RepID=UPI0037423126